MAQLDSSKVVTTDVYTYIGVIVEVLNEGLPRSAFLIIGDKSTRSLNSRVSLSYTLITFQILLGAIMTVIFLSSSVRLAAAFVPMEVRASSLTYVRISSVSALSSAMETAVSSCTRALDHPDVPLLISSVKFAVNIILDLIVISKFHVHSISPTVNTQAVIRLVCDMGSAICGLLYFIYIATRIQKQAENLTGLWRHIFLRGLMVLIRPSIYTFVESALRNALYLWLITGIVSMSTDYATAWGIFNTIRWGLVRILSVDPPTQLIPRAIGYIVETNCFPNSVLPLRSYLCMEPLIAQTLTDHGTGTSARGIYLDVCRSSMGSVESTNWARNPKS